MTVTAENTTDDQTSADARADQADSGNYEVIRQRLLAQGQALLDQAEDINGRRKQTFGGTELAVIANERVRTENNCVPRDIVQIGGLLLFGYNVFIGLKTETSIADVFALHRLEPAADGASFDCDPVPLDSGSGFLTDADFHHHFQNLYRYFRDARLLQLVRTDTQLLAVFQSGNTFRDIKVFRWRIEADGNVKYVDDRGDRDYVYPRSHDFEWTEAGRDHQVSGRHPHVAIADTLFLDNTNGHLTVKIEDNTETGEGIYDEALDDANQILDDAQFHYAELGELILVKVLPFREEQWRYLVFNKRNHEVVRIDAIGQACLQLPEDHGILFPGGFYLQTGANKVFDGDVEDMEFKRAIRSPNGEDVLYIFHRRRDGHYALFSYNLIRKEVATPIHCHGYSLFDDGRLVVFRAVSEEPTRVHPMQIWQTPFMSAEHAASAPTDGSFLAKVGNAELVRGISDAFSVCRLVKSDAPSRQTFEDIIAQCGRAIDAYYWLDNDEIALKDRFLEVRRTAELIVDEFEKVVAFRERAKEAIAEAEDQYEELSKDLNSERWNTVEPFMKALTELRKLRGHLISMREIRYIDLERIDELEQRSVDHFDRISRDCVNFLMRDAALSPLKGQLDATLTRLDEVKKVADARPLREQVDETSAGLDLLSEVVANLQIEDTTQRTTILERISEVFAHVNRVRATIESRYRDLLSHEGKAEFGAQFKLLGQSVSSALSICDTPDKCDEELARIMVQLEELEGRFSEYDEFLADLASKREEIYDAFGARKQTLLDERQRRAQNILKAAERILDGVGRRAQQLEGTDDVNGYFAADAMVMKLRQLGEQLEELGETVKADELEARLKRAKQDALRGLRDRLELFEDGANIIKLGSHRFTVNTQKLELTMVPRDGEMALHLAGTDFYEAVDDDGFVQTRAYWDQDLVSETPDVYRAEYLAASILFAAEAGEGGLTVAALHEDARRGDALAQRVTTVAQERYDEGYERGIHDSDATLILEKLLAMHETAGLLRFAPVPRAAAALFWARGLPGDAGAAAKARWHRQAQSLGRLREAFADGEAVGALARELANHVAQLVQSLPGVDLSQGEVALSGRYLLEELMKPELRFIASAPAVELRDQLIQDMEMRGLRSQFDDDLRELAKDGDLDDQLSLARAWVGAFLAARPERERLRPAALEAAAMLVSPDLVREPSSALTEVEVAGLLGGHPRIQSRAMVLRMDEFLARLSDFANHRVPGYRTYRDLRHRLLETERERLRLDEFKPKILSAFVRNKLINDVYLPMIGDNLAKQMGAAGDKKRTDLMGMLLLISPPGYGKTTLMEYVANRLGLVFVKVNGPALGHSVHSLDPSEAPNATARQEVERINLAFEMGNNVMLYLDDIQHTHPELLQKFISLCDGQRRVEGVWQGKTRTYDLRGKKFCVIMAGNPYTESGESFQIPDMLSNRADVYNLGDVLSGKDALFALSYIENSLTSNAALAPLATREQADTYKLIRMAQGEDIPSSDLSHGYSAVELNEIVTTLKHLFVAQDALLKVNAAYIASAAQDDAFRTEPPFKLQGSYRNMNKLAEKIVSAMTSDEVDALLDDHYLGEAQTLTTEAESNLLKLREMRGVLTDDEAARWSDIKAEYNRRKRMGGGDDDPVTRVTGTLSGLNEQLDGIKQALANGHSTSTGDTLTTLGTELKGIRHALIAAADHHNHQATVTTKGSPGGDVVEALAVRLDALVSALARAQPVTVQVDQPPPAGVEQLLAQQVAIVERTLVPLVKTATQHLDDSQALAEKLDQVIAWLRQVDVRLRSTAQE